MIEPLVDAMRDGYCRMDQDDRIVEWNPAASSMTGLPGDQVKGKRLKQVLPQFALTLNGPNQAKSEVAATVDVGHSELELRAYRGDGSTEFIFRRLNGEKEARPPAGDLRVRYRTIFEEAPISLFLLDQAGLIEDVNSWHLKNIDRGLSAKESYLNQPFTDRVPGTDRKVAERIQQLLSDGVPFVEENLHFPVSSGGRPMWANLKGMPLLDNRGDVEGAILIMEDITERRALQRQLLLAKKMESIGTMAKGIAHDFNNILGIILSTASYLRHSASQGTPAVDRLKKIEEACYRGSELTKQIQAFSRESNFVIQVESLNDIVRDSLKVLWETLSNDIHIEIDLHPHLNGALIDRFETQHLITVLCINARDAMPTGGTLTVRTSHVKRTDKGVDARGQKFDFSSGAFVCLSIADSGSGIPSEELDRIFDPFYTTKGSGNNRGLGLYTVYGIVRDHQGLVEVNSSPGEGTTFDVYLPAISKPAPRSTAQTLPAQDIASGETILIVDDEEGIRDAVRLMLEEFGFKTYIASDGHEAMHIYHEHWESIDLVLLDLIMPSMSGREVYRELIRVNPDVRVMLSSGSRIENSVKQVINQDRTGFVPKPYVAEDMVRELRKLLDS